MMTIAVGRALIRYRKEGAELNSAFVEEMQALGKITLMPVMDPALGYGWARNTLNPITVMARDLLCGFLPVATEILG